MPKITFIEPSGAQRMVSAIIGKSVMEAAVQNSVRGIDAECGGACACATCHVWVDEAWRAAAGQPEFMEEQMLEYAEGFQEGSRLSCQIKVTEALDGLIVAVATS